MTINDFKNEFADAEGIHLNNAGMAPISRAVAERLTRVTTENQFYGSMTSDSWLSALRESRQTIANFIDTDVTSLALTLNCGMGLSQAAMGFPLRAGDRVVTLDQEYSSNFYPWKVACERSGAELVVVKSEADRSVSLEKLLSAITPGVKLVGLSWVEFQTGTILDLKTIGDHCHRVGAFFVVDVIQGLGQLPFSFRSLPVDFIAGASHKWLAGLTGQGFMAMKPEFAQILQPLAVGGGTYNLIGSAARDDAKMESSVRRFETGGINFHATFALQSAMQLLSAAGVSNIAVEITRLSKILREGLLAQEIELVTPLAQAGGITSFRLGLEHEMKFLRRCKDEKIALIKRGEFVRVSTHAFNRDEEMDRVLELLKQTKS